VSIVADEIQSGLGRTGELLACEHEVMSPDVVTLGETLSGGMHPASAVLSSLEVLGVFEPGDHGSTFGGNPLACAVAREALKVIVDEDLCERSAAVGGHLTSRLPAIDSPHVRLCRGKGLLVGIVLKPDAGGARRFCEALKENGVLEKDTHGNVIRLAPPLIVAKEELDWRLERAEEVLMMA
jgi:ornithine--oxo-acid transaminase